MKKPPKKIPPVAIEKKKEPERKHRETKRYCLVCKTSKPKSEVICVTTITDRIFLFLSSLYRKLNTVQEAKRNYKCLHPYSCKVHFGEASTELLNFFMVSSTISLVDHVQRVQLLQNHVELISGLKVQEGTLVHLVHEFIDNYPRVLVQAKKVSPLIVREEDIPVEETVEHPAAVTQIPGKPTILPKPYRQPRKQVLEKEETDDSILRIIKKTEYSPRTYQVNTTPRKDPYICCFCLEARLKCNLLKVPKSRERQAQWAEQLGEKFALRIRDDCEDYFLCRSHFPREAFSVKGRLLRGSVPIVLQPPKVVAYKIDGDDFVQMEDDDDMEEELEDM